MNIRTASDKDAQSICEIGKESFLVSHGSSAPEKDIKTFIENNYNPISIAKEIKNPTNNYSLLIQNKVPFGFSNLIMNSSNHNISFQNVTKLDRIYFLEESFGKGMGAQLLKFNIDLARKNKQAGIWLHTWIKNKRAITFYKKFGFKITGRYDYKISETHSNPNYIMFLMF